MRIRALIWCVIATWLVAMGGCGGSTIVNDTFAQKVSEPTTLDGGPPAQLPKARIPAAPAAEMNTLAKEIRPEIERGTGRMVLDKPIGIERQPLPSGGDGVTLNLNGVPVAQAAKANRTARLQVGDQVPIVTQTTQSVAVVGAPIVSTVTMKDTGIILAVTPRVPDSGRVNLDIEQEASNVARTTTSGIDSPTIQQRKIKTTVTVSDGQVLVLGGLIQQRENVVKTEVPLLGSLPVVGNAGRQL